MGRESHLTPATRPSDTTAHLQPRTVPRGRLPATDRLKGFGESIVALYQSGTFSRTSGVLVSRRWFEPSASIRYSSKLASRFEMKT